MLLAFGAFVALLAGYVMHLVMAYGRSPAGLAGGIFVLTVGGWIGDYACDSTG